MVAILSDATVGQMNDSKMWVILGVTLCASIYLLVLRPLMRRKKDPLERPPAFASLSRQRDVEREMQNLLVELSEMARQITAQLDTRAKKLEMLIQDADRRIAELKSLPSGAESAASSALFKESPIAPSPALASDPRHSEIYALADQGRNVSEIASDLSRPTGEVELILALREKGAKD